VLFVNHTLEQQKRTQNNIQPSSIYWLPMLFFFLLIIFQASRLQCNVAGEEHENEVKLTYQSAARLQGARNDGRSEHKNGPPFYLELNEQRQLAKQIIELALVYKYPTYSKIRSMVCNLLISYNIWFVIILRLEI
jgi:hypothetical protein